MRHSSQAILFFLLSGGGIAISRTALLGDLWSLSAGALLIAAALIPLVRLTGTQLHFYADQNYYTGHCPRLPAWLISTVIAASSLLALSLWLDAERSYWTFNLLFQLSACAVIFIIFLIKDRSVNPERENISEGILDFGLITLLIFAAILIYSHSLTDVTYSVRGIESGFYSFITETMPEIETSPFHCWSSGLSFWSIGTYCSHPAGISYYQKLFLGLFDDQLYAWRLSSVVFLLTATAPLFLIVRTICDRPCAYFASIAYLSSYYLHQFSHLAYNNAHFVTFFLFTSCGLIYSVVRYSTAAAFAAGVFGGLGVYFNHMCLVLPVFSFLFYVFEHLRTRSESTTPLFLAWCCGSLLALTPLLFHTELIAGVLMHVPFLNSAFGQFGISDSALSQITNENIHPVRNFVLTLLHPLETVAADLYYINGYLFDFASASLAVWGVVFSVRNLQSRLASVFAYLLFFYLAQSIIMGLFNRYSEPSVTRMLYQIPCVPIFAAIALYPLSKGRYASSRNIIFSVICVLVVSLNALKVRNFYDFSTTTTFDLGQRALRSLKFDGSPVAVILPQDLEMQHSLDGIRVLYTGKRMLYSFAVDINKLDEETFPRFQNNIAKLLTAIRPKVVHVHEAADPGDKLAPTINSLGYGGPGKEMMLYDKKNVASYYRH